jgi:Raf kinase inhibitor-like YbhB/YbcL family protein
MEISSSAFANNENIPAKYTCDGDNISPPLTFSNVPENTKTLLLLVDDPDSPNGTWIHWSLWNIDPSSTEIKENEAPENAKEGMTSFGFRHYGGPCPPSGTHRYFFKLYALDKTVELDTGSTAQDLAVSIDGHVLEEAALIGLYSKG